MKKRFLLFLLLSLLVTGFIFFNSFQGPDSSNESSGLILKLLSPITGLIDRFISDIDWNFVIRKGAHFTEFCVLGILSALTFISTGKKVRTFFGYNLFCVLSVALTDEFIQSFTGRTSSVRDVFLDFCGAAVGIGAVMIINNIRNRKRR